MRVTVVFLALGLGVALVTGATAEARVPQGGEGHAVAPGVLEGRPPAPQASPIQALIDRARPGDAIEIGPGSYAGDLVIDRPLTLVGRGRPLLLGSGSGSVVRIRADGVTVEGFDVDGRNGGDLGRDSSGIHVSGRRATVRDCRIRHALFGVYLREAHGSQVVGCRVDGIPGRDPGEKGSGIHVWNTEGFRFERNVVEQARDGIYIQSSSKGRIVDNSVRDVRYGLHYMFSDDNVFEGNLFETGAAGTAIMYSRRITFRRNRFLHNRGFASVGLLFQGCDEVVAEDNLVADNARGIFLEASNLNVFRRNVIAQSDVAIVLYGSCARNRFEGNSFVANLTPLNLVGKRTDTVFDGNYWSDNDEPDLDGDGRSDRPYRLSNVFDHLRGNLTAADLFAQGIAASALGVAEQTFPVLEQLEVVDRAPLAHAPALPNVPLERPARSGPDVTGLAASLLALAGGAATLAHGRKRPCP